MKRNHRSNIVVWCIAMACFAGTVAYAQYQGMRVDNGQQHWQNYWQFHQRRVPTYQSGPAAGYQRVGGYFPTSQSPQKPFSNYQPSPNAYDRYWPLMLYPNTVGSYF